MPRAFYDKVWRTTSHLLFFRIIYKHTSKNNSVSKAVFSLHLLFSRFIYCFFASFTVFSINKSTTLLALVRHIGYIKRDVSYGQKD